MRSIGRAWPAMTTDASSAKGSHARISPSCGPSTLNGSLCRPATMASMVAASGELIDRYYGKNGASGRVACASGGICRDGDAARTRSRADARRDCGRDFVYRFRGIYSELRLGEPEAQVPG